MADHRRLIAKLAVDRKVLTGTQAVAEKVAARARQIDPAGDFVVTTDHLVVNGLNRAVAVVTNQADDATESEYGTRDRQALRPLGRASAAFKG